MRKPGYTAIAVASALVLSACSGGTPESAGGATEDVPVVTTPRLEGADNFRDVAGSKVALPLSSGSFMQPERVYRSNALVLEESDQRIITDLGVNQVIDLRTADEAESKPDVLPDNISYLHIDVLGAGQDDSQGANLGSLDITSPDDARQWLIQTNEGFVRDAGVREALREVFEAIANNDGAVIFHCTAGKDRAGWVSAVLQLNAGVPRDEVVANYLLTNDYSAASIQAQLAAIEEQGGPEMAEAYAPLLGVEEQFLSAGLDAMDKDYGSVDVYLKEGLGLSQQTIDKLQDKLTV